MKSGKFYLCVFLGLFFLISACHDDKEKGDYSGVSDLISDRNKARYELADPNKKGISPTKKTAAGTSTPELETKEEELSSIILYEEEINILGADSGRLLAKGVAYINKKGQIVKIKIVKDAKE